MEKQLIWNLSSLNWQLYCDAFGWVDVTEVVLPKNAVGAQGCLKESLAKPHCYQILRTVHFHGTPSIGF